MFANLFKEQGFCRKEEFDEVVCVDEYVMIAHTHTPYIPKQQTFLLKYIDLEVRFITSYQVMFYIM